MVSSDATAELEGRWDGHTGDGPLGEGVFKIRHPPCFLVSSVLSLGEWRRLSGGEEEVGRRCQGVHIGRMPVHGLDHQACRGREVREFALPVLAW